MTEHKKLKKLRNSIRAIDGKLLKLCLKRIELSEEVGNYKLSHNLPVKNYEVEKIVVEKAREKAKKLGLYEDLAEELVKLLIHYSVQTQEEHLSRNTHTPRASEERIAVIGGAGKMGQWLCHYFDSFGYQVSVYDQRELPNNQFPSYDTLEATALNADILVIATPIRTTKEILDQLIDLHTKALIIDLCSLKSPLLSSIQRGIAQGLRIASVHPMFGPNVKLLSDQNVLICETTDLDSMKEAEALFKDTPARLTHVPLEKHDAYMSYVLGLSHLINLAFANTVAQSEFSYDELQQVASSTFRSQLGVTLPVVNENEELYYEIQKQNLFTDEVCEKILESLEKFRSLIKNGNHDEFVNTVRESRQFFLGW